MLGLFDERVRRALEVLTEADGRILSFAELKAAGVERPSQIIYELELAGHPIEHSLAGAASSGHGGGKSEAQALR